jgi:hypothetical protein
VQGFVLNHPGIYPQHMITRNLQLFLKIAADHLRTAWRREPLSLLAAREELRDKTMPIVKSHIVEAMRRQIPGTRIDGKLLGQTAGGVFDREATIVDTTTSTGFKPFQTRPIGLRAVGAARSYDVVSKLSRSELNRTERLAMLGANNVQEYKSSLKAHRLSAYHATRNKNRKK